MGEKINFEDFAKNEMRVGKILEIEDHPRADKLYVLKVDLGESSTRTIVAGLKPYYKKEELERKLGIFVTNLKPVKLRGIESNGMILAAQNKNKTEVIFLTPEKKIEIGSKVS